MSIEMLSSNHLFCLLHARQRVGTNCVYLFGLLLVFIIALGMEYQVDASKQFHNRTLDSVLPTTPHKDFLPVDRSDVLGSFLISGGLMIAASGGIGGGGMLLPLLIIVFGFNPKNAIPLSNITILGSSITNVCLNLSRRHPEADRPLIDWDLLLIMEPLIMAGAIIGAILRKLVPEEALDISLVILLAYTACTTLFKARMQYIGENQALEMKNRAVHFVAVKIEGDMTDKSTHTFNDNDDMEGDIENTHGSSFEIVASDLERNAEEIASLIELERRTPLDKVCLFILMLVVVVGLNILKGGEGHGPIGIQCGTRSYWFLTALTFIWMCVILLWVRSGLVRKWKLKQRIRYRSIAGDIEWNKTNTILYPCFCSIAGLIAGLFGMGGGIVNGPLLLQLGVHPLVAAATTAVMLISTNAASSTMFSFNTITWDYGIYLFILGTISTIIGQFGIGYFVHKYKRYSYISFSIGFIVVISAILLGVLNLQDITENSDISLERSSLCSQ